jgi:DNA (cytosine-5)-methyltransferase 1
MKVLDLFCGAGGAAMGLHRAWPDAEITGVDIKPMPRYPFKFIQGDAMTFPLEGYDFIWASPPCQAFSKLRFMPDAKEHANHIPTVRELLVASGTPYAIENVEDAPLGGDFLIMLCGTMFGLQTPDGRAELRRHRLFETSFSIPLRPACQHGTRVLGTYGGHVRDRCRKVLAVVGHTPVDNTDRAARRRAITVTGHTPQTNTIRNRVREVFSVEDAKAAMGIDWMTMSGLSQAVPPAYSEFIAKQFVVVSKNGHDMQTKRM